MKFLPALLAATQFGLLFASAAPAARPNIVFIFSDDHAQVPKLGLKSIRKPSPPRDRKSFWAITRMNFPLSF